MGGDASLLHLASQLDRGIQRKLRKRESEKAKKFRSVHNKFLPLKYTLLVTYGLIT